MNAQIAWEIFQAADCFGQQELRDVSMTAILKEPKKSLAERPAVCETLLQEVLGSDLLCISHEDLFDLLVEWDDAVEEGRLTRAELIQKYVAMQNISEERLLRIKRFFGDSKEFECIKNLKIVCMRSEHTTDVLYSIRSRFDFWANKPWPNGKPCNYEAYFLINWVHLLLSPGPTFPNSSPFSIAHGMGRDPIGKDEWLEWNFPRFAVKLLSIQLAKGATSQGTSLRFLCKGENSAWQEIHVAKDLPEIQKERVIPCRSENLVKGVRVEVASGSLFLSSFAFEGLLQERD